MTRMTLAGIALSLACGLGLQATADERMRIERVDPDVASPGDTIEILGENFGSPAGKSVIIWRVVRRKPVRYAMRVSRWSDSLIEARIPAELPADTYAVYVFREGRPLLSSNHARVTVPRRDSGGGARYRVDDRYERASIPDRPAPRGDMLIRSVGPDPINAGRVLAIKGDNFGRRPDGKIVAINLGRVNRMDVVEWSDNLIRARIPRGLAPGSYRVLIYYDGSYQTSSNSLSVAVR